MKVFSRKYFGNRLRDERGQGMAEYIIITILVAIVVLVGVRVFGKTVSSDFGKANSQMSGLE